MGRLAWIPGWAQYNHNGLYKREEGGSERVEDVVMGARVWSDVRKGPKPRNSGDL